MSWVKKHKCILKACVERKKDGISLNSDHCPSLTCGALEVVLMLAAQVVSAVQGNICGSTA